VADVTTCNKAKTTKTGSARVLVLDADSLAVVKAYQAKWGAISLDLARADAYVFGNDAGEIRAAAQARDVATRAWGAPESRPRTTWALHDHHDDEHLQPRHPTMQKAAVDRFAAHLGQAQHISRHMSLQISRPEPH
jgi:hypothetical protein